MSIKSKLSNVGTSIFAVMTEMANKYNAINLSQGFPDFNVNPQLIDLVNFYMNKGYNQYAAMPGVLELRKILSKKINELYGRFYDAENEITITAGATQALFTAISLITNPNDEIIMFEPVYDSYAPAVVSNGGKPVSIKLNEKDFSIPWSEVENKISDNTKAIIINSPHNPTGKILSDDDIKNLEEIVKKRDIFIISDEVYEHIVFDSNRHISVCESEILYNKSFVISSFGKTFHTTGWKIGYCYAPEYLSKEFRKLHQFIVFAVNTPIQYAYVDFLRDQNNYLTVSEFYQKKRDYFIHLMEKSRFKLLKTEGTYFQLMDYSNISNKNDYEFSEFLTKEIGVAVIPLSSFYNSQYDKKIIRVCFAKKDEILKQAAEKLSRV
ncbi:MAG: methionine aminotransferase [Ignavibacterium sp.]|nr:methionine aminotransferase [Ignavibacterium sp.]MCX7611066.1 methionine aminotransferase [Ignavibacterium sp.]MDW8376082.1 methionine aminotransferase [Ignavibacteriales bacterium]